MATPPFRAALGQLGFVHQVYVILIQRIRRVGHLATSAAVSNQFVVVHVLDEAPTIIHSDPWLSHFSACPA
jgi:sensor domain CHASE-containing protein